MRIWTIFLILFYLGALASPYCVRAAEIAVVATLTGPPRMIELMEISKKIVKGVKIAAKEQNRNGGIQGETIMVDVYDDQGEAPEAIKIAGEIAAKKGILGVVGHALSATTLAAMPTYEKHKIPLLVPTAQSPKITEEGMQNVFRIGGRTDWMIEYLSIVVKKDLKWEKVALLYPIAMSKQSGLFTKTIEQQNLQVVYEATFKDPGDIGGLLKEMENTQRIGLIIPYPSGPDIKLLNAWITKNRSTNLVITKQSSEAIKFFGKYAKTHSRSFFILVPPGPQSYPEKGKLFEEQNVTSNFVFYPYLCSKILFKAACSISKKAKKQELIDYIRKNKFPIPVRKIAFDSKGDAMWAAYAVYKISRDGTITIVRFDGGGGANCCPPEWCCERD